MKRRMLMAKITAATLSGMLLTSYVTPSTTAYADVFLANQNEEVSTKVDVNGYEQIGSITNYIQDENKVTFDLSTGEKLRVSFLENGVFRIYMDPTGEFQEDPTPNAADHITKIIDKTEDEYKSEYSIVSPIVTDGDIITVSTDSIELRVEKSTSKMELINKITGETVWKEAEALKYKNNETVQTLEAADDEYFYGGGMQNGRFSHRGKTINIKNENNWVDGGVASPTPFYWSTKGYGVMRHTFKPGEYAFSSTEEGKVIAKHSEKRFDAYYFVDEKPTNIINEFTELTGKPVLLPEYGFYLGHLNCYARDWVNDETGQESQTQKPGFDRQETLMEDGKKDLDSHIDNDMPLGYFLPNDGYGCGYGREETIDGNIGKLKEFVDYAKEKGIQTGLWTQSTLKPTGNQAAYLERDIDKEVGVAGTNAVKTDVAWVGAGYSFALNSVRQAAEGIINNSVDDARPFVVSLDGWAGTQRYASIWSGDQYGGSWEYIRFHIPTYIGSGLSGQPNVGSDMDGIFGGSKLVQTRDFQWKAFTPIQLDMDGWGSNKKTPQAFGEPYTSINRTYLKLKSSMMSYNYSIASEATNDGVPMIRAMMLEYPDAYTYGTNTEYQYMWGPSLLVAPIYQDTEGDANGNDIRNDIYLPDEDQIWIDYFSGTQYRGGGVLNNYEAPIWKLPLFVKNGAIIPMNNPNNTPEDIVDSTRIYEVYPSGDTEFEVYEDDGLTTDYLEGKSATTLITSTAPKTGKGTAVIKTGLLTGSYEGMVTERETEFIVNVSEKPSNLTVKVGGNNVVLTEALSLEDFENGTNMYFYDIAPNLNKYATEGSEFESVEITTTPKVYVKVESTDVTKNEVELTVSDFINVQDVTKNEINENLSVPTNFVAPEDSITSDSIKLVWDEVEGADTYDVEIDGVIFKNIKSNEYNHTGLDFDTVYNYRVRSVNSDGHSEWSEVVSPRTALDPHRNVPKNMEAIWTGGQYSSDVPANALDGDDNSQFHSAGNAINQPFVVDMKKAYTLEKLELLFRNNGNGSVRRAEIYASLDGVNYTKVFSNAADSGNEAWATDGEVKTINFDTPLTARYFKLVTKESIGNFLTMREFRPYKLDGSEGKVVGDWNNSGSIEEGDLTFLENYTGLTTVDADWEYVSSADLNANGLIDAYDIAYVASKLEGGINPSNDTMAGELMLLPSKTDLKAGETFTVDIIGMGLSDVNAFSTAIPLDSNKYELVGTPTGTILTSTMKNLSKVRVHTDGSQDIYTVFTNIGDSIKVKGTDSVARITLKAKVDTKWDMELSHGLIVDSKLNSKIAVAKITDLDAELPEGELGVTKINSSSITVSGDETQLQTGMGLNKLIDGTTSSDDSSRMDLKWVYSADQVDKGTLPFEMTFEFDGAREFDNFTIYNRMDADGRINTASLKEVKAVGYLNGIAIDLGTVSNITTATTVYELNGQSFDKIVITALDSHKDKQTLAINEIEFYENTGAAVKGIEFAEGTVEKVYPNKITPIFANVLPSNANDLNYRVTSDNEEVVQVVRVDSEDVVNYYLRGLKAGTATITATTADGKFSVEKTITVGEGADKTLLIEMLDSTKEYTNLSEIYTKSTYEKLTNAIKAAQEIINNESATETEVSNAINSLRTAINGLEERDTIEENKISFKNIQAIDATSEATADGDLKENAVDGNEDSIWHSAYGASDSLPVSLTLKLDKAYNINQIDYLPRQNSKNGHVKKYMIETSLDGENWTEVRVGTLEVNKAGTALVNTGYNPIRFNSTEAQYVRFTALESLGDTNNKYASVAELAFYGTEINEEVEDADKMILEFTVEIAKEVTQEQLDKVVPVVKAEFLAALEEAEAILANEKATQAQVDASFERLSNAMQLLEFIAGDKTQLIAFVERVNELDLAQYIPSTLEALQNALKDANNVIADENALVNEVNEAYNALVKGYLQIRLKPSKDKLQDLINKVQALDSTKYTDETWAIVEAKLTKATEVMANEEATKEEIEEAISELDNAVEALEEIDSKEEVVAGDKSELQANIKNAQSLLSEDYTEDSFAAFKVKLNKAIEVNILEGATQEQIDEANSELLDAIDALVKVEKDETEDEGIVEVNKELLNALINNALNLDKNKYTSETWAHVMSALKAAQEKMANEEATQEDVNKAYDDLQAAMDGLKEAEKTPANNPTNGGTTTDTKKPNSTGKLPNTGGVSGIAIGLLGALTSALGFGISKKKKK